MKVYDRYCDGVKYWCECLGELLADVSCPCESRKCTRHHAKSREMLARIIRRIPQDADANSGKSDITLQGEFLAHIRVITSTLQLIEQAVSIEGACLDEALIEDVFSLEEQNETYHEDEDTAPADKLLGWGGLLGWGDEVEAGSKGPKVLQENHHVKQVACSGHRGLYVTYTGDVYKFGESGTGTPPDIHAETISAHNPKVVPELVLERVLMGQRVVAVACGHLHSVVITQGGRLWSWGCGEHGRLGHGDEKDQVGPRLCEALLEYNVRSIGCGGAHTIAVTTPSRVHAWGLGRNGRLGLGDKGSRNYCTPQVVAVNEQAESLCEAYHALFGNEIPQAVKDTRDEAITSVACGWAFTLLLGSNGTVRAFGAGLDGQCGIKPRQDQPRPRRVRFPRSINITRLSCGYHHALAIDSAGGLWSWGSGEGGQLGLGERVRNSATPKRVLDEGCIAVAAGQFHSVCIKADGSTWSWGSNQHCAVSWSESHQADSSVFQPERIHGVSATKVAAGAHFTIAVVRMRQGSKAGVCATFCGGRIYFWDKTQDRFLPRIGVLTANGCLEMYKSVHALHASETFMLAFTLDSLDMYRIRNVIEIWRTRSNAEYTLIIRFKVDSEEKAIKWMEELSRRKKRSLPGSAGEISPLNSKVARERQQLQQRRMTDPHLATSMRLSIGSMSARRKAWLGLIGNHLRITPELFLLYKERASVTRQDGIGMDVRRTLPSLLLFGKRGEPFYDQCRDVLEVFRCYRPDVGYVQGMSYIAAMLCLHIPDNEYDCFLCLANLLTSYHCFDFFRVGHCLSNVKSYLLVVENCLKENSAKLWRRIAEVGVMESELHIIVFQWMQTLFVRTLPLEQVTLLWDEFLAHGVNVMIKASVAVLLSHEKQILKIHSPGDLIGILGANQPSIDIMQKVGEVSLSKHTQHIHLRN